MAKETKNVTVSKKAGRLYDPRNDILGVPGPYDQLLERCPDCHKQDRYSVLSVKIKENNIYLTSRCGRCKKEYRVEIVWRYALLTTITSLRKAKKRGA